MSNFPERYPILFQNQWGARKLDEAIAAIDVDRLYGEYVSLYENAPNRFLCKKKYFVDGHDGIPSSKDDSNQREKHSAIALVNLQRDWKHPLGGNFRFLDYEVPLKAQKSDSKIGEIDIVGVNSEGRLIITELKLEGKNGNRGDKPPKALLQGLRYAAIVEANLKTIISEAESRFDRRVQQMPPIVQLLATEKWWQDWKECPPAGNWQRQFVSLVDEIESRTRITFEFLSFDHLNVIPGLDGKKPRLDPVPSLHAVSL